MVYGFAQQSRGLARMQSQAGEGTTVTLYLPRANATNRLLIKDGREEAPLTQGRGEMVLVVEDDPAVLMFVLAVLKEAGYRTMHAPDGATAVPLLQSASPIDLLVSDVGLPGLDGRELAEIARRHRPAIPVLFMTGYAEQVRTRADFLTVGMQIIAKPFAIDAFASLVQQTMHSNA